MSKSDFIMCLDSQIASLNQLNRAFFAIKKYALFGAFYDSYFYDLHKEGKSYKVVFVDHSQFPYKEIQFLAPSYSRLLVALTRYIQDRINALSKELNPND